MSGHRSPSTSIDRSDRRRHRVHSLGAAWAVLLVLPLVVYAPEPVALAHLPKPESTVVAASAISDDETIANPRVPDRSTGGGMSAEDEFVGLTPYRLLDTRIGVGARQGLIGPAETLELTVVGRGGVPATGVGSVVVNLTSTQTYTPGFITAWPTGEPMPLASNLNVDPGQATPNLAIVKVGAGGTISLFNSEGHGHLIADVLGYFPTTASFRGLNPARLLDTRIGVGARQGLIGPAETLELTVVGRGGVPATGVGSVVVNLTSAQTYTPGFITAWPTGGPMPLASNLNVDPGQATPNLAIVMVGAGGTISLYNSEGHGHLIADVLGYFPEVSMYRPQVPFRLLDTRDGTGGTTGPVGPGETIRVDLPADNVGSVVVNITSTLATTPSYITAWPTGEAMPFASNLNTEVGQATPNLAIVKTGTGGDISVFNSAGSGHLIIDVLGYFPKDASLQTGATGGATGWLLVPDTTKSALPHEVLSFGATSETEAVVTLAAGAPTFVVGDHISLAISATTPHGLLARVTSRTLLSGGQQRLRVTQAAMEDAFLDYDVSYDSTADPAASALAAYASVPAVLSSGIHLSKTVRPLDLEGETCSVDGDLEITLGGGVDWELNASLTWTSPSWSHPFGRPKAYVTALVTPEANVSVWMSELSLKCSKDWKITSKDKLLMAGPIPIVFSFEARFGVDLEVGLSANTALEASASASVEMGLKRNQWRFETATTYHENVEDVLAGGFRGYAMVDLWLNASVGLYKVWVVTAGLGPFVEFGLDTQPSPDPWWAVDFGLAGKVSLGGGSYQKPLINHEFPGFGELPACNRLATNTPCAMPAPAVRVNDEPRTPCIPSSAACTQPRMRLASAGEAWPKPLSMVTTRLPDALVDDPYEVQLRSDGGWQPVRWTSDGPLPDGLTLTEQGMLQGTPILPTTTEVVVRVTDRKNNWVSRSLPFRVRASNPTELVDTLHGWGDLRLDVSDGAQRIVTTGHTGEWEQRQVLYDRVASTTVELGHTDLAWWDETPSISSDGQYAVVGPYLHDIDAGTFIDITEDPKCENLAAAACSELYAGQPAHSAISGDGRYVVYEAGYGASGGYASAIVRYDTVTGLTRVVSVTPPSGQPDWCDWGDGFTSYAYNPSISDDGTVISFTAACEQTFLVVADLAAGTLMIPPLGDDVYWGSTGKLSGNGQHLFFTADPGYGMLIQWTRGSSESRYMFDQVWITSFDVDDDGDTVAFTTNDRLSADDTDDENDVYVLEVGSDDPPHLVSQPYGTEDAEGAAVALAIAGDGNTVTFTSQARLVPMDGDPVAGELYLYVHSIPDAIDSTP